MKRGNTLQIIETLARGKDTPATPIPAIDVLKGLSMFVVWYVHFSWAWHDSSWTALFRFSWYLLDVLGPSMFVVLSVIGNMAGYVARSNGTGKLTITRRKAVKASFLFIYGECINLFFLWRLGWFHLSGWNVITTIALFSILLPYMLRLRARTRIAIAATILICYYPLALWVSAVLASRGITPATIQLESFMDPVVAIYWFFLCQAMMTPLFPWIAVPLIVSVVFERFIKIHVSGDRASIIKELKRVALMGIVLVVSGIGFGLYPMMDFNGGAMIELFTPGTIFTYPFSTGIVAFLVRHAPQYLCYNTGCAAILFAIISHVHLRKPDLRHSPDPLKTFGRLSLTAFLLSHAGLLIPITMPMDTFFWIFVPLVAGVVLMFYLWGTRWREVGSLEWLMGFYTNATMFGLEYVDKKRQDRQDHGKTPRATPGRHDGEIDHVPAHAS